MNEPFTIIENRDHASWLKARTYGIGGSDASAIVGKNPYKTNIDLFEEKIGRKIPEDISDKPYVRFGTLAEPHIRAIFALTYPEYCVSYYENRILRSKQYPFLQASLDGELEDENGRKGILEIKTTNILQYLEIDSAAETVTKILTSGIKVNAFHYRSFENSVFRPIQVGRQEVFWDGKFDFDLILFEERSEPKWS